MNSPQWPPPSIQDRARRSNGERPQRHLTNFFDRPTNSSLRRPLESALLDSISNAAQTLQAANNGLTSLTKLVQSAQAIAQQALTSTITTGTVTGTVSGLTGATVDTFSANTDTVPVSDGTTTATYTAVAGAG